MTQTLNPATVAQPTGPYSQAVLVDQPGRWLHISGQIGMRADGSMPADFTGQATEAWRNLVALLEAAGMGTEHLVKLTTYLVDSAHMPALQPVRTGFLGTARPASTLVIVKELARKEWLFEVEAIAFAA